MASFIQRKAHFDNIRNLSITPQQLAEVHADTEVPEVITSWLTQLMCLNGVPFNYLVPDPLLLPKESIRFFQLDPNWIAALVEGAFSIGSATEGDYAHDQVMAAKLSTLAPGEVVSGFLLRSEVVKGWPNLGVIVFDADNNVMANIDKPIHLSDTVLLVMVSGATPLDHIAIHEHPEGLHFGVDIDLKKSLRYVTVPSSAPAGTEPGEQIPVSVAPPVTVPFRPENKRVIGASQLASQIEEGLKAANAAGAEFTSAEFALEMIEGVQSVNFKQG